MVITDIQFEVRSFRFEEPMKIAFATIVDMQTCIIRVLTDAGITGYGEAAPFSYVTGDNLETVISVGTEMKKALIGVDPRALWVKSTASWTACTRATRRSRRA